MFKGRYIAEDVAVAIEQRLSADPGLTWERVDPATIKYLTSYEVQAAWSLPLGEDYLGVRRTLYLALPRSAPHDLPTAFVRPMAYQQWPHAEPSGQLCLWQGIDRPDISRCEDLISEFFARIGDVIGLSLPAANADARRAEFEKEWLSYWFPAKDHSSEMIRTYLITPPPVVVTALFSQTIIRAGTERVSGRKGGMRTPGGFWKTITLFSADLDELKRWGTDCVGVTRFPTSPAGIFIPLRRLTTPGMPTALNELEIWIEECAGREALDAVKAALGSLQGEVRQLPVVFGLQTDNGHALCALMIEALSRPTAPLHGWPRRRRQRHLSKLEQPNWGVRAMLVDQGDSRWMQDRNVSGSVNPLGKKHVVVVGCGMLGSPIIEALARAGVGQLTIVDPDEFEPANVGRHVLGASYIGQKKVRALAHHIRASIPTARITSIPSDVVNVKGIDVLDPSVDLVICTTADQRSETFLMMERQLRCSSKNLLICWLEPYAAAGHALLSINPLDDLQAMFDERGEFKRPCTSWPNGLPILRLPACQATFQPAGMTAAAPVIAMCTTIALDQLLDPGDKGVHGFWFAEEKNVRRLKGELAEWTSEYPARAHLEEPLEL